METSTALEGRMVATLGVHQSSKGGDVLLNREGPGPLGVRRACYPVSLSECWFPGCVDSVQTL